MTAAASAAPVWNGPAPSLSVVIASHDSRHIIDECLRALEPQQGGGAVEVIVADSSTDGTHEHIASEYPWVQLLHFTEPLTLAPLRGQAIAAARGAVIAILDVFSVVDTNWARAVLRTHASRPNLAIGGAVGLHRAESRTMTTWATYFNEYGLFMPPVRTGPTRIVPGSNVSYKREALFDGAAPRYPVFWKTFVNWSIERSGSSLWLSNDIVVRLNKAIPFGDFFASRYHHGRCFGGMRVAGCGQGERFVRAASTIAVPPVLVWRWTRGFWPKATERTRWMATLPLQLGLFAMWACGEAHGYLRGSGRSCEHLFY